MTFVTEQDNQRSAALSPTLQAMIKAAWSERVSGLSAPLFDFIYNEHQIKTSALGVPGVKQPIGDVAQALGMEALSGRSNWYVEPTKAVYGAVQKLSKGFNLSAEGIALFFKDDNYIGSDIRGVLQSVEPPVGVNSNRIGFSCSHFTYACTSYIPETFFKEGNKDIRDTYSSFSYISAYAWNEAMQCETTLTTLYLAQKWGRVMPQVRGMLEWGKHMNLATIADRFTQRFAAMERHTIARAARDMQGNVIG